ncbi:MAG TPA: DoxX family protein [Candidatus Peribacteraceae bacterium]|nr:DoxX family protein [Candidatus Peribacteraceae bacterium]
MDFFAGLHMYADWGLLALRLVLGIVFLYHGSKKLNGKMGGFMLFIGICEFIAGLAVLVGFLTQIAALGLGIIMIGAWFKKSNEWNVPFSAQDKMGWEFDMTLLGVCIALFLIGGGLYGLDYMLWGI